MKPVIIIAIAFVLLIPPSVFAEEQPESDPQRYFSHDRITVEPGNTITIVNDDVVTHSLVSGKEHSDRYVQFTPDGRISTGDIAPGESVNITFDDMGFYRLYDPDYQWMKIVAYVFPDMEPDIIGPETPRHDLN